jgi:hypothetical protein
MEYTVPPLVAEMVNKGTVAVTVLFLKTGINAHCTLEQPVRGIDIAVGKMVSPEVLESKLAERTEGRNTKAQARNDALLGKLVAEPDVENLTDRVRVQDFGDDVTIERISKKRDPFEVRNRIIKIYNDRLYAQRRKYNIEDSGNPEGFYHPTSDDDPLISVRSEPKGTEPEPRINIGREYYTHPLTKEVMKGMTAEMAALRAKERKLCFRPQRNAGDLLNSLPAQSLCRWDYERGRDDMSDLQARVILVTKALGATVILGRIRSQDELKVKGAPDLETWWQKASGVQRVRLLMEKKHFLDLNLDETAALAAMMLKQPHPFLGTSHLLV